MGGRDTPCVFGMEATGLTEVPTGRTGLGDPLADRGPGLANPGATLAGVAGRGPVVETGAGLTALPGTVPLGLEAT